MNTTSTLSWEQYVAAGEGLNARFSEIAPMPEGASTGDYWTPVPNESGLYFRNVEWGSVWSGDAVVASVVGVQFSDGRAIDRHISFDCDDVDRKERIVEISFDTADRLAHVLTELVRGAR
ncbi:hypothetical protein ACLILY_07155 [Mycobacterium sp. MS3]|uniref:hypothetical protein n=1 Tax=Mycobacterium sp. MS3 TaxID=3391378 RepID=UPI003988A83A